MQLKLFSIMIIGLKHCCCRFQFKASEDHTWEQTVGSSSSVKAHTGPLKERKAKKNRWDN